VLVAAAYLLLGALGRLQAFLETFIAYNPAAVLDHAPAQRVDRPVVHDPEHPRAHAAARAVIARTATPRREERLLNHLFGHRTLAAHAKGERERHVHVTLVENRKRGRVVLGHQLHQILVGEPLQRRGGGLGGAPI